LSDVTTKPILSVKTAAELHNISEDAVLEKATAGEWFYSHNNYRFVAYVQEWDASIAHSVVAAYSLAEQEVVFELSPYSAVYEITRLHGFPSSVLLAGNLKELIENYVDLSDELEFLIINQVDSPILLGNKRVIDRLTTNVSESKFFRANVEEFLEGRTKHV